MALTIKSIPAAFLLGDHARKDSADHSEGGNPDCGVFKDTGNRLSPTTTVAMD